MTPSSVATRIALVAALLLAMAQVGSAQRSPWSSGRAGGFQRTPGGPPAAPYQAPPAPPNPTPTYEPYGTIGRSSGPPPVVVVDPTRAPRGARMSIGLDLQWVLVTDAHPFIRFGDSSYESMSVEVVDGLTSAMALPLLRIAGRIPRDGGRLLVVGYSVGFALSPSPPIGRIDYAYGYEDTWLGLTKGSMQSAFIGLRGRRRPTARLGFDVRVDYLALRVQGHDPDADSGVTTRANLLLPMLEFNYSLGGRGAGFVELFAATSGTSVATGMRVAFAARGARPTNP